MESYGAALGADGGIYVVGGTESFSSPVATDLVQIYDPATDSWSWGPRLHTPRQGHAVVSTPDGRIWAIGGTNLHDVPSISGMLGGEPATEGGPLASVEVLFTRAESPAR